MLTPLTLPTKLAFVVTALPLASTTALPLDGFVDVGHLLQRRELGELRYILGVVLRIEGVLVLHLGDEELQERVFVESVVHAVRTALRRLHGVVVGFRIGNAAYGYGIEICCHSFSSF